MDFVMETLRQALYKWTSSPGGLYIDRRDNIGSAILMVGVGHHCTAPSKKQVGSVQRNWISTTELLLRRHARQKSFSFVLCPYDSEGIKLPCPQTPWSMLLPPVIGAQLHGDRVCKNTYTFCGRDDIEVPLRRNSGPTFRAGTIGDSL
jgi:hypothetical protein